MKDKIITHYKVINKLGEGGMGVLYLAEDLELNRKAVLKFLPPDMINDPDTNLRFKREAQSAGSLSHPNIVTIYDVGVYENKTFIAMEYVEGKTLRELIKSDELTIERITDISVQICEGLNEAHSKGITHRDIKPENILIDEKGKVKIVDFGLAKIKNTSRGITKDGVTVGTIKYMSPQQIRNQTVDHRSDIWSFGVILYEMITGKYPFKGEHDASIFYSVVNQTPEPLARYKANIGEGFQRIIDKSLDKDPGTRYQHIDELLSDLIREKKVSSGSIFITKDSYKRSKKPKKNKYIIAASILLLLMFVFTTFYLSNYKTKILEPPKHSQLTFVGNVSLAIDDDGDVSSISPDGMFIAYVVDKVNGKSIYVKDILGEKTFEVFSGLQQISSLRWSPNGAEILFSSVLSDHNPYLVIVSRFGGKVQQFPFPFVSDACWSPDGSKIAAADLCLDPKSIIIINRNTNERSIKINGNYNWFYDIDWSPNGDKIVFLTSDDNTGKWAIWTIKTDGTQNQKIIETNKRIYSPRWSPDGDHIYYLQENQRTRDLMKIEISSNTSDHILKAIQTGIQAFGFSITKDSKILCFTKCNVFSNLWKFTFNDRRNLFQQKKLTEGTFLFATPVISRDGKEIAFYHKGNIFKMSVNGDSIKQLSFLNSECYSPSWSPDGKHVVFFSDKNIIFVSTEGVIQKKINYINFGAQLRWGMNSTILCQKQGNRNFYALNIKTGEQKTLVKNENVGWMFSPQISPDGKEVATIWYRGFDGKNVVGLWLISLNDSNQTLLLKDEMSPLNWSDDGKWIYVTKINKIPTQILMVNANTGSSKVLFTLPSGKITPYDVDISSDGKIIVAAIQETNSDVWMIENFDPDVE